MIRQSHLIAITRVGLVDVGENADTLRTCQEKPVFGAECAEDLREHGLLVLDAVRLVHDDIRPRLAAQEGALAHGHLVSSQADVV